MSQRKKSDTNYDIQLTALKRYKEIYGDILVPSRFEVPENSSLWPSETWNLKLGNVVTNIRAKRTYKDKTDELESIGFQFNPANLNIKKGYRRARDALVRYKELNGDMLVQYKFIVPCSPDWPAEMWGMKLGSVANNVRRGSSYFHKRSELEELGFDFSTQHKYGYDLVREGLVRYKELHGHVNVPSRFSIPIDHPEWRSDLGGMNLGIVVHDIRRGTYAERKEDLLSLGFKCVRIAVFKYRELNHGLTKIAANYKIHENDLWYPEETWGLCLGGYAKRIKEGALWPDKSKELFG
jgi:Helicase associated domain